MVQPTDSSCCCREAEHLLNPILHRWVCTARILPRKMLLLVPVGSCQGLRGIYQGCRPNWHSDRGIGCIGNNWIG